MANTIEIRLKDDFSAALDRLTAAAGEAALRSAGYAGARVFQEEAQLRAPVATGNLREEILVVRAVEKSSGSDRQVYLVRVRNGAYVYAATRLNRRKSRVGQEYQVEGGAFYWQFFEFGTSKMAARPFLRPAFEAQKDAALQAMKQRLREKIALELSGAS